VCRDRPHVVLGSSQASIRKIRSTRNPCLKIILNPLDLKTYLEVSEEDLNLVVKLGAFLDPDNGMLFIDETTDASLFSKWIPKLSVNSAELEQEVGLSLTDLLTRVGNAVEREMRQPLWVRVEVSDVFRNGYIRLQVVERNDAGIEATRAIANIWANKAIVIEEKLKQATGSGFSKGIKLMIKVIVKFNVRYGLSLEVIDIDPRFTLGALELKIRQIREYLIAQGEFRMNSLLEQPLDFTNIAVICPERSAGFDDFKKDADELLELDLCNFAYFHAKFQGDQVEESISHAFERAFSAHEIKPFDALVIIRGGGAVDDLNCLIHRKVARMICRFPVPVFTGIGHERDVTILDECSNTSFGTPSKVVAHIRKVIFSRAQIAYGHWSEIRDHSIKKSIRALSFADGKKTEIRTECFRILQQAETGSIRRMEQVVDRSLAATAIAMQDASSMSSAVLDGARVIIARADDAIGGTFLSVRDLYTSTIDLVSEQAFGSYDAVVQKSSQHVDAMTKNNNWLWESLSRMVLAHVEKTSSTCRFIASEITNDGELFVNTVSNDCEKWMNAIDVDVRHLIEKMESGTLTFSNTITQASLARVRLMSEKIEDWFQNSNLSVKKLIDFADDKSTHSFGEVMYFLGRSVEDVEEGCRNLMSSIVSLGVQPTLQRGFSIVYANDKPISSRELAASCEDLEVEFKDGRLKVKAIN
jgi:exodeoxyribonuclease VII large subunit